MAWMLEAMGHPNVSVLDGGFPKWTAEGKACATTEVVSEEGFGYKLNADSIKHLDQIKSFNGSEAERSY